MAGRSTRQEPNLPTVEALSSKLTVEQMGEISKRAMLVSLSFGVWDPNITDKIASAEVSEQNGITDVKLCRVRKTRVPRNPHMTRVNDVINSLREYHYGATLMWSKEGLRILPVVNFEDYVARVNLAKQQLAQYLPILAENFEDLKVDAKRVLGSLYREADYPSAEVLCGRYFIKPQFSPLPASNQFLDLGFSTQQEKELQAQLEEGMRNTLANATSRLWHDLYSHLQTLCDRVGNPDARLHESVMTSVTEMVEMLPRLNLLDDPMLEELSTTLQENLGGLTMGQLKANEGLRRKVHNQTSEAVARVEEIMFQEFGASQLN